MKLPSRDSATGRALATAVQFLTAVALALPALSGLLSDPEFNKLVGQYFPKLVPVLTFTVALATFVNNYLRKDVKNY
jgi:hypothetical protein